MITGIKCGLVALTSVDTNVAVVNAAVAATASHPTELDPSVVNENRQFITDQDGETKQTGE